ncbi:uncharacterized protein LOC128191671 [Crassostrea angulata]|uniref:uncharacterized protein LOC128191671 n=1 Tax=Magallana angulata TaxID=2784310 RepID=UPI0022B0ABB5|nr:uncharacterized protein LOC128191671 [Crassostrea angulata]
MEKMYTIVSMILFLFMESGVFCSTFGIISPISPQDKPFSEQTVPLLDLCRICELFTSDKPLECNRNCPEIPNHEAALTKSGSRSKTTIIGDALCAFCRKYPIYLLSEICRKKICS